MDAIAQLRLFVERVNELKSLRLLREWKSGMEIRYEQGRPTEFEFHQPGEEALRSFLLTFRQFFLSDEPIFMYRIYSLCFRHVRSDALKEQLVKSREAWKVSLKRSGFKLQIDSAEVAPETAMRLWINGHYFHSDYDKRELLRAWGPIEQGLSKQQFLELIGNASVQLLFMARVVEEALRWELVEG